MQVTLNICAWRKMKARLEHMHGKRVLWKLINQREESEKYRVMVLPRARYKKIVWMLTLLPFVYHERVL